MYNQRILIVALSVFILMCSCAKARNSVTPPKTPAQSFRVIGYLPNSPDLAAQAAGLDFKKITVLNIAFLNPDSTGAFPIEESLATVAALAHSNGVQVLVSIGGGNPPAYLKTLLTPAGQDMLVKNLYALVLRYGLDGIDVDLEGSFIDGNYESFVSTLEQSLKASGKLLTAAVATAYAGSYTDKALSQFDFINIMSYDKTGPWNPSNPGPHAPLSMAENDLAYWATTRGITQTKLNLGLPFYGYGFGPNAPESISYQALVQSYPASWNEDQVSVPGGGTIYYNGAATIKTKTSLALQKAGGVMIWQLLQDADGAYSLLSAIDNTIKNQ